MPLPFHLSLHRHGWGRYWRQGREQGESKGLFLAGRVIVSLHTSCGNGGGVWQCPRDGAVSAAPRCKCASATGPRAELQIHLGVLCFPTAHVKCFSMWQITGEGANICLTWYVLLIGALATKPTSFRFPCWGIKFLVVKALFGVEMPLCNRGSLFKSAQTSNSEITEFVGFFKET